MAPVQGVRSLYECEQSFARVLAGTCLSSNQGPSEISCRVDRKAGTDFFQFSNQLDGMLDGKLVGRNPSYTTWSIPGTCAHTQMLGVMWGWVPVEDCTINEGR